MIRNMVAAFFLCVIVVACGKERAENNVEVKSQDNDLPAMELATLDGQRRDAKTLTGKLIFVLFQPDCDHCQREAEQIRENLSSFQDYNLYFISSASADEIGRFAETYGLSDRENVLFATTALESVLNNYGPIQAPSIYIYSDRGKLVQSFNGEVDISVVLKYL